MGVDNFDPFYGRDEKFANLAAAQTNARFRLQEVDCANAPALTSSLSAHEVDVVVHLAAKAGVRPSIRDPVGYALANVVGTQVMLEWARTHGVRRFVFGSSSSVYGNSAAVPFREDDPAALPISPYAATKRAGELLCHTYQHLHGLSVTALRFFTVYGPRQRPDLAIRKFSTLMLRDEPIPLFGDGTTKRDYTWIDDIMAGVLAALEWTREHPGQFEIVNLGGNRATSLTRLVELIGDALGVRPRIDRQAWQPGDVMLTYADTTKAARLLGYSPSTSIEDGIPRFVGWLRGRERGLATHLDRAAREA